MSNIETVRKFYELFEAQNADAAAAMLAPGFTFTSPQDDGIDADEWLRVCFPTKDHFASHTVIALVAATPDTTLLYYEYTLHDGKKYSNVEAHTVTADGKIARVDVFFGGQI